MKNDIQIKTRPVGMCVSVEGWVGLHEVMSVQSRPDGSWSVGSSSCLPGDPAMALRYLECMNRVFLRAAEHGLPPQEQQ